MCLCVYVRIEAGLFLKRVVYDTLYLYLRAPYLYSCHRYGYCGALEILYSIPNNGFTLLQKKPKQTKLGEYSPRNLRVLDTDAGNVNVVVFMMAFVAQIKYCDKFIIEMQIAIVSDNRLAIVSIIRLLFTMGFNQIYFYPVLITCQIFSNDKIIYYGT